METSLEKRDLLNLANNDFVKSILAPKEEIYLSCMITKYNRYGLKQNRNIIITNMHCLNIYKDSKRYLIPFNHYQRSTGRLISSKLTR